MAHLTTTQNPDKVRINIWGVNTIGKHVFSAIFMGLIVFAAANTTDWTWGWVYAVVNFLGWSGMTLALVRWNPELLNARGRNKVGAKGWDWLLVSLYGVVYLVQPILAGFDKRYGWSGEFPPGLQAVGAVVLAMGFVFLTWPMVVNRYFEVLVRIQGEREHQVISSGPYRLVRHPGYLGVILQLVGMPLVLGSWITVLLGIGGAVLFVVRTALEDRTLQAELPGYAEYAQRVRYRLLPGVW